MEGGDRTPVMDENARTAVPLRLQAEKRVQSMSPSLASPNVRPQSRKKVRCILTEVGDSNLDATCLDETMNKTVDSSSPVEQEAVLETNKPYTDVADSNMDETAWEASQLNLTVPAEKTTMFDQTKMAGEETDDSFRTDASFSVTGDVTLNGTLNGTLAEDDKTVGELGATKTPTKDGAASSPSTPVLNQSTVGASLFDELAGVEDGPAAIVPHEAAEEEKAVDAESDNAPVSASNENEQSPRVMDSTVDSTLDFFKMRESLSPSPADNKGLDDTMDKGDKGDSVECAEPQAPTEYDLSPMVLETTVAGTTTPTVADETMDMFAGAARKHCPAPAAALSPTRGMEAVIEEEKEETADMGETVELKMLEAEMDTPVDKEEETEEEIHVQNRPASRARFSPSPILPVHMQEKHNKPKTPMGVVAARAASCALRPLPGTPPSPSTLSTVTHPAASVATYNRDKYDDYNDSIISFIQCERDANAMSDAEARTQLTAMQTDLDKAHARLSEMEAAVRKCSTAAARAAMADELESAVERLEKEVAVARKETDDYVFLMEEHKRKAKTDKAALQARIFELEAEKEQQLNPCVESELRGEISSLVEEKMATAAKMEEMRKQLEQLQEKEQERSQSVEQEQRTAEKKAEELAARVAELGACVRGVEEKERVWAEKEAEWQREQADLEKVLSETKEQACELQRLVEQSAVDRASGEDAAAQLAEARQQVHSMEKQLADAAAIALTLDNMTAQAQHAKATHDALIRTVEEKEAAFAVEREENKKIVEELKTQLEEQMNIAMKEAELVACEMTALTEKAALTDSRAETAEKEAEEQKRLLEQTTEQLAELKTQIGELASATQQQQMEFGTMEARARAAEEAAEGERREKDKATQQLAAIVAAGEESEAAMEEEKRKMGEQMDRVKQEADQKVAAVSALMESTEKELAELRVLVEKAEQEKAELTHKLTAAADSTELDTAKQELSSASSQLSALLEENKLLVEKTKEMEEQLEKMEQDKKAETEKAMTAETELVSLKHQVMQLEMSAKEQMEKLEKELSDKAGDLTSLGSVLAAREASLVEAEQAMKAAIETSEQKTIEVNKMADELRAMKAAGEETSAALSKKEKDMEEMMKAGTAELESLRGQLSAAQSALSSKCCEWERERAELASQLETFKQTAVDPAEVAAARSHMAQLKTRAAQLNETIVLDDTVYEAENVNENRYVKEKEAEARAARASLESLEKENKQVVSHLKSELAVSRQRVEEMEKQAAEWAARERTMLAQMEQARAAATEGGQMEAMKAEMAELREMVEWKSGEVTRLEKACDAFDDDECEYLRRIKDLTQQLAEARGEKKAPQATGPALLDALRQGVAPIPSPNTSVAENSVAEEKKEAPRTPEPMSKTLNMTVGVSSTPASSKKAKKEDGNKSTCNQQ